MLRIAGQHYRIHGDPAKGLSYLFKAARMPFPDRSVFNWHHLYKCLSKLELGRAVTSLGDSQVTLAELKDAAQLIGQVQEAAGLMIFSIYSCYILSVRVANILVMCA